MGLILGRRQKGVSELYASLLMVGVTLSFGGVVAAGALGQLNSSDYTSALASTAGSNSAGKMVAPVFGAATPSGSCPVYKGFNEGTTFTLALYNYGSVAFTPASIYVNSTVLSGTYSSIPAGSVSTYTLPLAYCAHSTGQTVVLVDSAGDEVQVGT